jgi:hypothetical protein
MLLIRAFETAIHRLFLRGEVHGTTDLYAGQGASAVGVCIALERDGHGALMLVAQRSPSYHPSAIRVVLSAYALSEH